MPTQRLDQARQTRSQNRKSQKRRPNLGLMPPAPSVRRLSVAGLAFNAHYSLSLGGDCKRRSGAREKRSVRMLILLNCLTHSIALSLFSLSVCTPNGRKIEQSDGRMGNGDWGWRRGRKGEKGKAACLSRQVFAIATETCGIGKCDAAARERGWRARGEGGVEEVSPFLTLTFCTSTLIWGAQRTRPLLSLSEGFMTLISQAPTS